MKQIYEREGVLLEVEYELDGPTFVSARVLDDNYRATGPNLLALLDKCYLETTINGDEAAATKFFSLVVEELPL